jgi:hypothetical protein
MIDATPTSSQPNTVFEAWPGAVVTWASGPTGKAYVTRCSKERGYATTMWLESAVQVGGAVTQTRFQWKLSLNSGGVLRIYLLEVLGIGNVLRSLSRRRRTTRIAWNWFTMAYVLLRSTGLTTRRRILNRSNSSSFGGSLYPRIRTRFTMAALCILWHHRLLGFTPTHL